MGKDPSMPFYVNDWLSSSKVACMTLEQQGAYVRLLCHCWASQDASIPDNDEALAKLSGMNEGWLKGGSQMVRVCFEPNPHKPGFLTNSKLLELWLERQEWRQKSQVGGLKSAESRRKSSRQREKRSAKGGSTTVGTNGSTKGQPKGNSSSSSSSSSSLILPSEESSLPSFGESRGGDPFDPNSVPIPTAIDTPRFREAWTSWIRHRDELTQVKGKGKGKPLTKEAVTQALKKCVSHGEDVSVAKIENSIARGWHGIIFDDDGGPRARPPRPGPTTTYDPNAKGGWGNGNT